MKLTSMQKMILAIVAIVAVALLVVVLVILPLFTQMGTLDAEMTAALQQKQQAQALLAQLEQAKLRASQTQAELLRVGTQMPDSPQLPTLIIELQDMANQSGVYYTTFAPGQPTPVPAKNLTEIPLNVVTQTTWADLLDYTRRLNKSTRLIRVTNITITPIASTATTETADQAQQLTVTLSMRAYVIGLNGQVAPSSGATATPPAGQ